ncbi:hypothetical protein [Nostoc flagelliforme]|uniref:hypothetical protein n=1 Tax=Nostoc flagelliforme TaxID=1306274 RepID=UPI001F54A9D2|nr:hypothetical protein [Nostoc flagelliforme]
MSQCCSNLRRHQRRISGRKSTVQLRDFGQYQVLFLAENEKQLLEQIQQVPIAEYKAQRRRLAVSEAPRQQKLVSQAGETTQQSGDFQWVL